MKRLLFLFFSLSCFFIISDLALAEPVTKVSEKERCPVCGMFVAKFDSWISQIQDKKKGEAAFFDGVKDMMAYYFDPQSYKGIARENMGEIWVKDYYTLKWIPGQDAFYVIGSDVYGPMGHELIPFSSSKAAKSFLHDHKGKQVLSFFEIFPELIGSMRSGQRMR